MAGADVEMYEIYIQAVFATSCHDMNERPYLFGAVSQLILFIFT